MRRFTRAPLVWIVAAVATAAGVLVITSVTDEGGKPATTSSVVTHRPPRTTPRKPPSHHGGRSEKPRGTHHQVQQAVRQSPSPRLGSPERRAAGVVRAYVAALNARDGKRACSLFVPGGLASVRFPRDRGSCAASLSASVGYRDPRGFPVYVRSRVARVPDVAISGASARVTATVVTHFAEGREPSIEDDVIYLTNRGGRWLIVKPSATLYRAIGVGNIPPQVLSPP